MIPFVVATPRATPFPLHLENEDQIAENVHKGIPFETAFKKEKGERKEKRKIANFIKIFSESVELLSTQHILSTDNNFFMHLNTYI